MENVIDRNKCMFCQKSFVEPKRLYKHLFDNHSMSKQQIEDVKLNRRESKVSSSKKKPIYPCDECGKPYLSKLGLTNHKKNEHNAPKSNKSSDTVHCPINICSQRFVTYFDLAQHCYESHTDLVHDGEVFRIHRLKFADYDKFQDWRTEQEQQTESKFYTRSTDTKCSYGRKTWFMKCLHTQKTSKTVDFYHYHCPAFIRVVERNSGQCEAVACFGHLGHPHYTQNKEAIQYIKRDVKKEVEKLVTGAIAFCWFSNALEHVPILVGVRAEREHLSRILKIAIEHDERIKYIDHVMVYHTGLEAIVELHIVMDENLPLKVTHDISHPLEKKLLKLDFVERAFVHCDYDCDGD